MNDKAPALPPLGVVAVRMGYGHLRAAHAVAELAGVPVLEADRPPLAGMLDRLLWGGVRFSYESVSRLSQDPLVGPLAGAVLEGVTRIPSLEAPGDLSLPDAGTRLLGWFCRRGFGRRLAGWLQRRRAVLVTTFYAAAMAAAAHSRQPVLLVVTDSEVARAWVEERPEAGTVLYCVPAEVTRRRLLRYGVPEGRIRVTGFPLPPSLAEEPWAKARLEARLGRLEGRDRPVHLALVLGGAAAQAGLALELAGGLVPMVAAGRLRLSLVTGTHQRLARRFAAEARQWRHQHGLDQETVRVVHEPSVERLFDRFNLELSGVDVLWTKPSEMVFFAALGLPLILAPPVGAQEEANRRWVLGAGAGLDQPVPQEMAGWLQARIADGTLAAMARRGYERLPRNGSWEILDHAANLAHGSVRPSNEERSGSVQTVRPGSSAPV